uniref:Uncharacterized protein n=1 Tax=Panagrolaimus sp. PS1159 TaxID=55785 RepID=A0AC35F6L1_9BILA
MSENAVDDEEQLRQAIELSKQTYNEEQRKRNNSSPEDLMGGDPDEIQRQKNIAEITALYNAPLPGPSYSFISPGPSQQFMPRSNATLPYGFRPNFLTQNPRSNLCTISNSWRKFNRSPKFSCFHQPDKHE